MIPFLLRLPSMQQCYVHVPNWFERILYCKGHLTLSENMHLNEIRVFDLVWLWQLTFWSCFWYATLWGRSPWARFCNFCWDPSQRESTCNFLLSLHQGLTLAQFWIRKYHAAAESLKLKIFYHPNESIFKRIVYKIKACEQYVVIIFVSDTNCV